MPLEHEGIYPKYLVFKHPDFIPSTVNARAFGPITDKSGESHWTEKLAPVEDFVFVLKPDSDHHARVAIAAYAESVSLENPGLAKDLRDVL